MTNKMTDPTAADLRHEVRGVVMGAAKGAALCMFVLAAGYFLLPRFLSFPEDRIQALIFTMRVDLFVLLWVVAGVGIVGRARRHSAADIGTAAFGTPTRDIRIKTAFLQNTLEQSVIAIGSHLVLSTLVSGAALSFIVSTALLFAVGRICFYRGYRRGAAARSFGLVTTALPGLLAIALSLVLLTREAVAG